MINSELDDFKFQLAITLLKGIEIDGESTEHLLELIGMKGQMLRQLVMCADKDDVNTLLDERAELDGTTNISKAEKRLGFISKDIKRIDSWIKEYVAVQQIEGCNGICGGASVITIIENIRIASDLNDNEPEENNWK